MKLQYLLFFIIVMIILFILYFTYKQKSITENMAMPAIIPGNNSMGINISTMDNMRSFLEQLHMITSKDEIKDASYNFCAKMTDLASWMNPTIGNLKVLPVEKIFETYGSAAVPEETPTMPSIGPSPIPIINNYDDYIKMLTIVVRGSMIVPLTDPNVNIYNKLNLNVKPTFYFDASNGFMSYLDLGLVDCANAQYIPIRNILLHFHNQLKNPNLLIDGDTVDTTLMPDDKCNKYVPSPFAIGKRFIDFATPGSYSSVIPYWVKKIRVLVIGAGGGGGSGGGGCHVKRGKDASGGGGASGHSGTVIYTTEYNVTPKTRYNITIGSGGSSGSMEKNGGQGGTTTFAINNASISVGGAIGGGRGNGGTCNKDRGNAGIVPKVYPTTNVVRFGYNSKSPNWGTNGGRGSPGKWLQGTAGGDAGRGSQIKDFSDISSADLGDVRDIMNSYGYGGNGGYGVGGFGNGYFEWAPGRSQVGTPGGSGYVRIMYY